MKKSHTHEANECVMQKLCSPTTMITSKQNPRIRNIRALFNRAERDRTGLAYVEGLRQVTETFAYPAIIHQLIIAPALVRSQHAQALLEVTVEHAIPTLYVSADVFASLSLRDGPQGIAAVVKQQWVEIEQVKPGVRDLWIALEAIQDPGNLGTVLRTCDATGCHGVILLDHCTDPYDPTALRASMGALFSLQIVKASFQRFVDWKRQYNCPVIGTADTAVVSYRDIHYPLPGIILMGSERQGLFLEQQAFCDQMVSIPMSGHSDSLNVAIATAIIAYEALHQRRG